MTRRTRRRSAGRATKRPIPRPAGRGVLCDGCGSEPGTYCCECCGQELCGSCWGRKGGIACGACAGQPWASATPREEVPAGLLLHDDVFVLP